MEDLKVLVKLISRNKLKQVDLLENSPQSKLKKLYDYIQDESLTDDEEAAKVLFPNNSRRKQYYQRLKRKLKERLIDHLFLIDLNEPNYTSNQKAFYNSYKNLAAGKILIGRYQRESAIPLLEKTLKRSLRYEFTEISLEISKELRLHYGTLIGDKKKFKKYNSLTKDLLQTYQAELLAEEYYTDLAIHFSKSKAAKPEIIQKANSYHEKLMEKIGKVDSFKFNFLSYLVFSLKFEIGNDFRNTLIVCKEALTFFNTKKGIATNSAKFTFLLKSLNCYIQLKEYSKGKATVDKCLDLLPPGSNNWFLTLDYYMILCFHSNQMKKAYETYLMASAHPNFHKQSQSILEHWKIHEAFISYFTLIGKIKPKDEKKTKKFRVGKFLNEVPNFSKDKRGINISILIINILMLLQQKKYGDIIDKIESIKAYDQRYLRKDETFRSSCFIKMLLLLPKNSFHKAAIERKSQKYLEKLKSVPLGNAHQTSEVEIVPYELLWKYITESLETKFQHV